MRIIPTPQRREDFVIVSKKGEVLTINGDALDFAELLPNDDNPEEQPLFHPFVKQATRKNGELTVILILPHGPNPNREEAFPEKIENAKDGVLIDQPAQAAAKMETAITALIKTGIPENVLREAVSSGRKVRTNAGMTEYRTDCEMLAIVREWQTTGVLVK